MNLIGTPVMALIESAAPPRASPSSLVSTRPVRASASWKALATLTASWPSAPSATSSTSSGCHAGAEFPHLLDQFVVDLQAAGGVEQDGVGPGLGRGLERRGADGGHVLRDAVGIEAELLLLRQDLQLVDGRGALDVAAHDERPVAALLEQAAELGGRGRLARAVQADQQHLERTLRAQLGGALAEELHQFVVDDLDDLLGGRDGLEHLLAGGLRLHAFDELAGDLEMHVGGEQGGAHLLEGVRHVLLGELADAAQVAQRLAETFRERFKHGSDQ